MAVHYGIVVTDGTACLTELGIPWVSNSADGWAANFKGKVDGLPVEVTVRQDSLPGPDGLIGITITTPHGSKRQPFWESGVTLKDSLQLADTLRSAIARAINLPQG